MRSFQEWATAENIQGGQRPWLVLGKGPSFAKRDRFDLNAYSLLSLNHAVREQPVDLAHAVDLDVIRDCPQAFDENARFVVLPWVPHVKNRPGKKTLEQLLDDVPLLRKLDNENRLLCYNLGTEKNRRYENSPVIRVRYFSAEAAIRLLAMAGVPVIRTLGIDGGASYDARFSDLSDKTLLSNQRSSFDMQFKEFAGIIMDTDTDLAPLDTESPVRVYVATTEDQMLSVKVLEYSIKKHASMSVFVYPLQESGIEIPVPKDPANRPRTPFSFQRLLIPELAGYQGKAIYLDSDMQLFKDIKLLWNALPKGASMNTVISAGCSGRKPQFSVMVMNCAILRWNINDIVQSLDSGELDYADLMYQMSIADNIERSVGPEWNSLEYYKEGETALLHYTDMPTQPWIYSANPLGYLWVRDLIEAIENKFIDYDYVRDHVERGFVRPSLLYQIENGIIDGLLLPRSAKKLDRDFSAPYVKLAKTGASPWVDRKSWVKAVIRSAYQRSGMSSVVYRLANRRR
jgi:hypothetical protein